MLLVRLQIITSKLILKVRMDGEGKEGRQKGESSLEENSNFYSVS